MSDSVLSTPSEPIRSADHRERILQFITAHPGHDDDEIASALNISPRQTVNFISRSLSKEGLINRVAGPSGKLVNYALANVAVPSPALPVTVTTTVITEDQVKRAIAQKLETTGWSVRVAWGHTRGIDIDATKHGERWIIECKGTGSVPPMMNNYFIGVLGELLQRLEDGAKHSIAFPDLPKYRRLWSELPAYAKERLKLTALFVQDNGTVQELFS